MSIDTKKLIIAVTLGLLGAGLFLFGIAWTFGKLSLDAKAPASQPSVSVEERLANLEKQLTEVTKENKQLKSKNKPTEPTVTGGKLIFYPSVLYGVFYPSGYERLDSSDDEICINAGHFQVWFNDVNTFVRDLNKK